MNDISHDPVEQLAREYDERVKMFDGMDGLFSDDRKLRGKETRDLHERTAATLRALLAAKEAAEAECQRLCGRSGNPADHRYWEGRWRDEAAENEHLQAELTRLRAERGASWLAGRDAAADDVAEWGHLYMLGGDPCMKQVLEDIDALTPPADDAAALEALIREGKAEAWDEGNGVGPFAPSPYRQKENG